MNQVQLLAVVFHSTDIPAAADAPVSDQKRNNCFSAAIFIPLAIFALLLLAWFILEEPTAEVKPSLPPYRSMKTILHV